MSTITEDPELDVFEDTEKKTIPPYNVIILNDDFHSMDFVVMVIQEVFKYEKQRSITLMLDVHKTGRRIVWTGSKEVAELKQEQVSTIKQDKLGPIGCEIEPAK